MYRDDNGRRPLHISAFGPSTRCFYSTIGICDQRLKIPPGRFEFAAAGSLPWLPNALVSSVYWLKDRNFDAWPLICEDAVKTNVKSTYRHMGFLPSSFQLSTSKGVPVQWLLGVPLKDSEIGFSSEQLLDKIARVYPGWFTHP